MNSNDSPSSGAAVNGALDDAQFEELLSQLNDPELRANIASLPLDAGVFDSFEAMIHYAGLHRWPRRSFAARE